MSGAAAAAGLLASTALRATVVLACFALVDVALLRRRGSAAARHLLWCFAVAELLLLPVLAGRLPAWRLPAWGLPAWGLPAAAAPAPAAVREAPPAPPALASVPRAAAPAAAPNGASSARPNTVSNARSSGVPNGMPNEVSSTPARPEPLPNGRAGGPALPSPSVVLLLVYAAGVALLLLRIGGEQRAVRRLARAARPVGGRDWADLLDATRRALGVRRPVALLRGDAPTVPLTWGVLRPAVLLPPDADAWPASRRRAVLLHELAHVARHDCLTQTLAAVACALYWPHPGAWWAARRLRVERELACDDRALAEGVGPHEYAGHLLELARGARPPRAPSALAVSMATRSHLESRLRAAVDGARVRTAPGRAARAAGAALTAALLLPVAAFRPGAAPAGPAAGEATAARADARAAAPPAARAEPAPAAPSPNTVLPNVTLPNAELPGAELPNVAPSAPTPGAPTPRVPAPDVPAPGTRAQEADAGAWYVRAATRAEAGGDAPAVHVLVTTNGITTFVVPLARMDGLTAEQVASPGDSARFRLRRDAGTLVFRGVFRGGRGEGRFGFAPDSAFAAELARRGVGRPTAGQLFSIALHDVSRELVDALAGLGYATPSPSALVTLGVSGADLGYLRAVSALGYRFGTTGALVDFANSGVTPAFIRAVAGLGYRDLPAADLVRLQNHSLNPGAIRALNARAGRQLAVAELVAARVRGSVPQDAAAQSATQAPNTLNTAAAPEQAPAPAPASPQLPAPETSATTPLGGRWTIAGTRGGYANLRLDWDDGTNWDRYVPITALRGTSADAIAGPARAPAAFRIEQDAGAFDFAGAFEGGRGTGPLRFRPNRAFGATLRALGVDEAGEVTDHQLKNLAWGGVSASAVRAFRAAGVAPLTLRTVVDMAIHQVTPEYVDALRAMYPGGRIAASDADDLRHGGVPPTYVRDLVSLGYRNLPADALLALWRERVTPGFIRLVRESGAGNDAPESLVALRRRARAGGVP